MFNFGIIRIKLLLWNLLTNVTLCTHLFIYYLQISNKAYNVLDAMLVWGELRWATHISSSQEAHSLVEETHK